MSNHFSAAMLNVPADDPRLDLTDLLVFASPGSAAATHPDEVNSALLSFLGAPAVDRSAVTATRAPE
jgi:hypothetical protein